MVCIVQDNGEVVGDLTVTAGDGKVAQFAAWPELGLACEVVRDTNGFFRGQKSQRRFATGVFASGLDGSEPACLELVHTFVNIVLKLMVDDEWRDLERRAFDDFGECLVLVDGFNVALVPFAKV